MKHINLSIVLAVLPILLSAQNPIRITTLKAENAQSQLINAWREKLFYDNDQLLTNSNLDTFINGQWILHTQLTQTNDASGHPIQQIWRNRVNNAWQDSLRETRTIDNNNPNTETKIVEQWSPSSQIWINMSRIITMYDDNNNIINQSEDLWNSGSQSWVNASVNERNYNAQGNLIFSQFIITTNGLTSGSRQYWKYGPDQRIEQQRTEILNTGNNTWEPSTREYYVYADPDNNPDTLFNEVYSASSNTWSVSYRGVLFADTVDNTFVSRIDYQNPVNGSWKNTIAFTGVYTFSGFITKVIWESWLPQQQEWQTDSYSEFLFNADGSPRQLTLKIRDYVVDLLYTVEERRYDYAASSTTVVAPGLAVQVFPNPFTDFIRVKTDQSGAGQPMRLLLTDQEGRHIRQMEQLSGNEAVWPVADLPSGIYLLRVEQGGGATVVPVFKR